MRIYFLLFFTFALEILNAQISVQYASANSSQIRQVVKKEDGNYLVVILDIDKTQIPNIGFTKIFEMNNKGKFIDSVVFKNDTQNIYLYKIIPVAGGYTSLTSIRNRFDTKQFFSITRFDKRLKVIRDTLLPVMGLSDSPSWGFDQDSTIILFQRGGTLNNYFGKIDKNGILKSWKKDTSYFSFAGNNIIVRKDSALYTLFFTPVFITLDTVFNKKHESRPVIGNIGVNSSITPINDSTVCIAGKGGAGNTWQHFFGITTFSGRVIFTTQYYINLDTAIWQAGINCTDTTKSGEWYWGGTYNFIFAASGIASARSYFLLHKLNKNYSTKWTKRYGGDAYYEMYGVLAKDDGGCLMYGTRYDYNNTPKFDAYILNVDADGVITSESSIPLNMPTITAYPNPSNGQLSFKVPPSVFGQIDLAVFDISGKLVYQKKEAALSETFDLSNLPNGNYLYQIFQDGTPLSVGKWQKIGN